MKNTIRKRLVLMVAMLALALAAVPALAQPEETAPKTASPTEPKTEPETQPKTIPPPPTSGDGIRGFVTDISGTVVLVEENPSAESGERATSPSLEKLTSPRSWAATR